MNARRSFLKNVLGVGAGAALARAQNPPAAASLRVVTPDVGDLPFTLDNGVKVFQLTAEPVKQTVIPGRTFDLWGFNGSAPGPTIQVNEGDRVRIVFDNHLPEPTAIHWHGLELPIQMDGVPGVSQKSILPGARFVYEFSLHQHGTFFYHSHMAMQEMVGMLGGFIIHPKIPYSPPVDRDYLLALQEYAVLPNSAIPDSMKMEFNWLTLNGKAGPSCTPLIVKLGERVRIRVYNLGMDHHPMHLHGFTFWMTGHEGARLPETIWTRGNTALVGVAQARDIEFIADRAGDWMFHCHLPHHMMNQMTSTVGPMTRLGAPAMPAMDHGNMPGMDHGKMPGMDHGKMPGMDHSKMPDHGSTPETQHEPAAMKMPEIAKDANQIPLFPQDAYMEGPMMAMDKAVEKPETYGLPPGWSGFMGGMMTLVRILPPDLYEKIMQLKAREQQEKKA